MRSDIFVHRLPWAQEGPGTNPGASTIHNPSDPSGNLASVGSSSTTIAVI